MPIFNRPRPPEPGAPPRARRADPLEAALRAAEVLSGGISTADAVAEIRRAALGLVGASHVSLLLLRPDGRTLELVAAGGLAIPAPEGSSLPAAEGVAGHVVSTARPVRLDAADTPRLGDLAPVEGDGESVLVPLRAAGDPIGVLHLALPAAMRVTDDDVRLMQLFADQAAGAIHRARLQERAERRSGDLMALVEASRGLVGALDTDALLHAVLEGGLRLAGSDRGFTSLFQGSPPKIVRGAFRGFDKATIARLAAVEEVGRAAGSGEVVALAWEDSSLIVVGLGSTRATSGVLVAEAGGADVADRIDLLRAFGGQCASALSAADLHTQVLRKESEMNSIIHGVPYPIVLTDADLRVVTINWAAEQLFGTSSAWVAGASAADALPNPALVDLLSAPGDVQGEIVAGSPGRTYKVRAADVRVPGAPRGRVAIMDDVTSEREMVQMQRDFVAMIGHELRTPLTIVKGFARTALRRPEDLSETARDAFQTIDARAGQLERLIEDLLYVSKIEAREARLRHERVPVAAVARAAVDELQSAHPGRAVEVDVPPDLTWVLDEAKMRMVLRHLVDNALKYSDAPAPVVVRAWLDEEADRLRIDVVDRGAGIISSDIPHIFERFRQIDSSSTRRHGGTGVGLYLCLRLVRAHEGRIWVESAWGKGSTFSIALPPAVAPPERSAAASA